MFKGDRGAGVSPQQHDITEHVQAYINALLPNESRRVSNIQVTIGPDKIYLTVTSHTEHINGLGHPTGDATDVKITPCTRGINTPPKTISLKCGDKTLLELELTKNPGEIEEISKVQLYQLSAEHLFNQSSSPMTPDEETTTLKP